jgi:hypothetical protein
VLRSRRFDRGLENVDLVAGDSLLHELDKSDLFVSYYCMQFVPPRVRQRAFDLVYETLSWGGALILFKKVRAPDVRFQDIATTWYSGFKRKRGLEPEEILNKAESLKGGLISKGLLPVYERDRKNRDANHAYAWFRLYCLLRWADNKASLTGAMVVPQEGSARHIDEYSRRFDPAGACERTKCNEDVRIVGCTNGVEPLSRQDARPYGRKAHG